jgi:hypothetical protein
MDNRHFDELVRKAKAYNHQSVAYAETQLWASRDIGISMTDIKLAIQVARGQKTKTDDKTILYILSNDSDFLTAERELKAAVSKMIDAQIKLQERCGLDAAQSNRILEAMTQNVKEQLFTETLLRNIW